MSPIRASHKAAVRSLNGHLQFVVSIGTGLTVVTLGEWAKLQGPPIEEAFKSGGKRVPVRDVEPPVELQLVGRRFRPARVEA